MRISAQKGREILRLLAVVSGLVVMLSPGLAAAATSKSSSSNITTSPISADLTIKPGESKTTTLQVENNAATPVSIAVELKTFTADGTSGQAAIHTPVPGDPTLSYVHFSQTTFTAQPGVFTPVQMTVSLPPDASLGYYYAVLFKPILPNTKVTNTNNVTLSNAILVLVDTQSSNENRSLTITHFSANHKIYEYLPANFSVLVHNNGNIFVPPEGVIYVSRHSNLTDPLATLSINKPGGRVLPQSSRAFTVSWNDGFPVFQQKTVAGQPLTNKKGKPIEQLRWNFSNTNHFRFGKYYAQLVLVYSNGQRQVPAYATLSFWVIPWKLILLVLLIIALQVLLIVTVVRYRRLYRRAQAGSKPKETK